MVDRDVFLLAGFVAALLVADAFRARARREWRARLCELLARAVRWGAPLAPLLARVETALRGRARRRTARLRAELEAGGSLADAFARSGWRAFPRTHIAEVRAAQGTSGVATVLDAQARRAAYGLDLGHRVVRAAFYPALLALLVWLLLGAAGRQVAEVREIFDMPPSRVQAAGRQVFGGTLAAAAAFLLVWAVAARRGRTPGARLHRAATLLRPLGVLLGAGVPLPEALRRCGCLRAAAAVEQGRTWPDAVAYLGLPAGVAARVAARAPDAHLAALAEECERRRNRRMARAGTWLLPATIVVLGAVVLAHYASLAGMFRDTLRETMPW